jgi:hypothetical protein
MPSLQNFGVQRKTPKSYVEIMVEFCCLTPPQFIAASPTITERSTESRRTSVG